MAYRPQQNQGGQNPLFGTAWMQRLCPVEWLEFCDKSQAHVDAVDLAGKEAAQDIRKELSPAGHGITQAINVCKDHVDQIESSGQIDSTVAADLRTLLDKLKERALEDRKNKAKGEGKKSKATTPEETAKLHMAMTGLIEIERRPVEAWVSGLSTKDRARLIKAIVAMSPAQAVKALQDLAICTTDDEKTARARANALIGQEEPSILALALLDLAKDDQPATDQVEAYFAELRQSDAAQYASLIDQLALFDDRADVVEVLKVLGKTTDFDAFSQKCRNRHLIR